MSAPRPASSPTANSGGARGDRSGRFVGFIVVFGLLSALALLAYGLWNGGFGGDKHAGWQRIADQLRQQNEPILLSDVKPADIPPKQNFFAADVFAGVAEGAPASQLLQRAADPGRGLSVADLLAAATQGNGASLDAIANAMQRAGLLNAKTDFLLAGDRVLAGMRALGLDFTPLADAADRPSARFPIDYKQPFPKLPHLRHLETLGDWLAIRAIAQLSIGDSDAAALNLLLIWRLADAVAPEPFLPSQRTRRLLLGLFAGCVRVGIDWGAWNDDQLAKFTDALERARLLTDFAWALRGERAQLNSVVDNALNGRKPQASEDLQAWFGDDLARLDIRALRMRQVAVNESIQHFLDALSASPLQPADLVPADVANLPPSTPGRLKTLADDTRVFAQLQTYLAQAETACALERFHLEHGKYPEKSADLAPDWLAAIPNDPITGQPLEYAKKDAGFVLTGAGWSKDQPWTWTRRR